MFNLFRNITIIYMLLNLTACYSDFSTKSIDRRKVTIDVLSQGLGIDEAMLIASKDIFALNLKIVESTTQKVAVEPQPLSFGSHVFELPISKNIVYMSLLLRFPKTIISDQTPPALVNGECNFDLATKKIEETFYYYQVETEFDITSTTDQIVVEFPLSKRKKMNFLPAIFKIANLNKMPYSGGLRLFDPYTGAIFDPLMGHAEMITINNGYGEGFVGIIEGNTSQSWKFLLGDDFGEATISYTVTEDDQAKGLALISSSEGNPWTEDWDEDTISNQDEIANKQYPMSEVTCQ